MLIAQAPSVNVYLPRTLDKRLMKQTKFSAARLKGLRKTKGLTQVELSALSGVSQQQISDYESGNVKSPYVDIVARLAAALGTTVEYLVGQIDYAGPLEKRQIEMLTDLQERHGDAPSDDDMLDVWLDHLPKQE